MSSSSFLVASLGFYMNSIMPSTNSDSFTISFPSWIPFISFYSPIATARTSKTMLNKSGNEQFSSVTQLCLTFCHPMGSRPGFLFIINCWSLLKVMSIKSVMPSNNLILCHPLLLLPSIFPSIRVFSNESVLHIRWPKYWSFSFNISPSNEYSGLISFRIY